MAKASRTFGILSVQQEMNSSDEEQNHPCYSSLEADVEANIRIEGASLVGSDLALINALDTWMEPSGQGAQRVNIDADMSALNLG